MLLIAKLIIASLALIPTTNAEYANPAPGLRGRGLNWIDMDVLRTSRVITNNDQFCDPQVDGKCMFVSYVQASGDRADWLLFDSKCKVIGDHKNMVIPTKDYGFSSELPQYVKIWQDSVELKPKILYNSTEVQDAQCLNGGQRQDSEDIRPVCKIMFTCKWM